MVDLKRQVCRHCAERRIVQGVALRQEKNEPEIWDLPRLFLTPYRDRFGLLSSAD